MKRITDVDWDFTLSPVQTAALTRDVHRRLRNHAPGDGREYAHTASYPIFQLAFDPIIAGSHKHLSDNGATTFTGRIHHHLSAGGGDSFIGATSLVPPHGNAMPDLRAIFASPLNARIDAGARALSREPKLLGARLIVVPQFYITALWLHRPTHHAVYLVDAPDGFPLSPHAVHTDTEFIAAIRTYRSRQARRQQAAPKKRPSLLKVVRYDSAKSTRIAEHARRIRTPNKPSERGLGGDDDAARPPIHENSRSED